ncbi:MAG: hypothetical protein ABFD64_10685 [Armatimonadota bacterium]
MASVVVDDWVQRQVIQSELMDEESIEWVGQPDPSIIFTKADIFLIPFSILWCGFAIFWEASALGITFKGGGAPLLFALFGVPFVLIGLYMVFGRFFYKAWKKRKTYYAVTNKRIIVITLGIGKNIQAVFIRDIPMINQSIGANGMGSLIFGNTNWQFAMYGNTGMGYFGQYANNAAAIAFYDIRDAKTVYDLVNRIRNRQSQ